MTSQLVQLDTQMKVRFDAVLNLCKENMYDDKNITPIMKVGCAIKWHWSESSKHSKQDDCHVTFPFYNKNNPGL